MESGVRAGMKFNVLDGHFQRIAVYGSVFPLADMFMARPELKAHREYHCVAERD